MAALAANVLTVAEYMRRADAGQYGDRRTELIAGRVVHLSPVKIWHNDVKRRLANALERALAESRLVEDDCTVRFSEFEAPQPDVIVCKHPFDDYDDDDIVPSAAELDLVAEVSDSTYAEDAGPRLRRYAGAGISEYWIVCRETDQVEVYTEPVAGAGKYSVRRVFRRGDSIELGFAPGMIVSVSDFLRRPRS
jgi:Uma2 family endonuclease